MKRNTDETKSNDVVSSQSETGQLTKMKLPQRVIVVDCYVVVKGHTIFLYFYPWIDGNSIF